MSRTTSGSGPIAPFAPGNENCNYSVLFDASSNSTESHGFTVDNNFVRVAAFNLAPGETVVIEQITGLGGGTLVTDYAPVSGQSKLYYNSATDQRTSYVLERPGRYRAKLIGGGLRSVHVYAIQYFIENEASQDVADALYAVINRLTAITPCTIGAMIPRNQVAVNNVVGVNNSNCLVGFPLVSGAGGNTITLRPDGVYSAGGSSPTACTLGAAIPDAVTSPNNYVGKDNVGCLEDAQLLSDATGNLLQLRDDGLFYGATPPPNFANQYVSSSTGNDSNAGTIGAPLKTIRKALQNLPDGTAGNIWLYAGDTFYIYPEEPTDNVITDLNRGGAGNLFTHRLSVGNRQVFMAPYNDVVIDAINAYNLANNTFYFPYNNQQIDFPLIKYQVCNPPDDPGEYQALGFDIDVNGVLQIYACNQIVTQIPVVNPACDVPPINSSGILNVVGGFMTLSNFPFFGDPNSTNPQSVSFRNCVLQDHGTPSTPLRFANVALSHVGLGGDSPSVGGGAIGPGPLAAYTFQPNNAPLFLASNALWQNNTVFDSYNRLYSNVFNQAPIFKTLHSQTGATYTLVLADANTGTLFTNAGGCTVTIPTNATQAFVIGTKIYLEDTYNYGVTAVAAGGVTLYAPDGSASITGLAAVLMLEKTDTNTWIARKH
jgi:hypothetical protein